jgi:lipoic acid synthetase
MAKKNIPSWIKVKAPITKDFLYVKDLAKQSCLETVCQSASCPNIAECWQKHQATFMIMGDICTRQCRFCNIQCGKPKAIDKDEPRKVALAVKQLKLKHAVITSVTRDDLEDGGAMHFSNTINEIRKNCKQTTIEVLIPDFLGKKDCIEKVIEAKPDIINYNIETVRRLHKKIKIGSDYNNALWLLKRVKELNNEIFTKSGLIVGMGETDEEVFETMDDLLKSNVDFLTIGQYLKPNSQNPRYIDVDRFVSPETLEHYKEIAIKKGFLQVSSSPLTRSSYHSGEDFERLKKNKQNRQKKQRKVKNTNK